jgi:hypothetical protein
MYRLEVDWVHSLCTLISQLRLPCPTINGAIVVLCWRTTKLFLGSVFQSDDRWKSCPYLKPEPETRVWGRPNPKPGFWKNGPGLHALVSSEPRPMQYKLWTSLEISGKIINWHYHYYSIKTPHFQLHNKQTIIIWHIKFYFYLDNRNSIE